MADGNMSNFLATDKVPDTIFGIPIVSRREDYTEADIAFFKEHPEAGGYYDMGGESAESRGAFGGGDSLEDFVKNVALLPAASINNPVERAKNSERSERRRQDRIKNMWADIAIHDMERKERDKAVRAGIIAERDANLAAQRSAQERQASTPIAPKARDEIQRMLDSRETMIADPLGGVQIMDGRGNIRKASEADMRNIRENKQMYRDLGVQMATNGGKTYDTVTPKEREAEYQAWKMKYAPNDSGYDYDLRGAFLEGFLPDPKTGHWPDKYKKPNHPTFSVESKYAVGADANLAGTWDGETYVPNPNAVRELWNRAVKSTGNLDGMARVFAAMSGESSLSQRGATAEQISNGHLARLIVHANETDRYNGNPANRGRHTTLLGTVNRTSHVLSPKYAWGTGPGANWFDSSKMEPRFDLINSDPVASKTARSLIMNTARFLNGDLRGKDWLPSDAVSYGDGPKGLMPDREEIKPEENRIGPMPRGFRIGRKKGTK